ncbi:MAG: TIGR02996 domain-containing protein [Proteobacteria bacterium]|nr:TIGR02996 domain-containing protein [Pseudomonadota bacterium]
MPLDARNADLERAIVDDPDDVDSYLVYADWLIEHGDPRGELITAQIAAERGDAAERRSAIAVFARHRPYLFGQLADAVRADALHWRRGFIHHAHLANPYLVVAEGERIPLALDVIARQLLQHPSARFLVKLTIGDVEPPPPRDYYSPPARTVLPTAVQPVLDGVAGELPPTLRELHVVEHTGRFRIDALCASLPNLTDLEVTGRFTASALALPNLRRATFRTPGMSGTQLRDLARASLPRLTSLVLALDLGEATPTSPADLTDLEPLLRRVDLPLEHLAIVGCRFANQLLARLATAPLLARLTELQITDGNLDDRGARALAREHRAFRHLELFDVTGNKLTAAGIRVLRTVAPDVIA